MRTTYGVQTQGNTRFLGQSQVLITRPRENLQSEKVKILRHRPNEQPDEIEKPGLLRQRICLPELSMLMTCITADFQSGCIGNSAKKNRPHVETARKNRNRGKKNYHKISKSLKPYRQGFPVYTGPAQRSPKPLKCCKPHAILRTDGNLVPVPAGDNW